MRVLFILFFWLTACSADNLTDPGNKAVSEEGGDTQGASTSGTSSVSSTSSTSTTVNRPPLVTPRVENLRLVPSVPVPGNPVVCRYEFVSSKEDGLDRSKVSWWVDGIQVETEGATLPGQQFARGQSIACEVVPFDGADEGAAERAEGRALVLRRVGDLDKRAAGSGLGAMTMLGEKGYFSARDPLHGDELWVTDGTSEGTTMVKDIDPGPAPSFPDGFVQSGDRLFFVLNTPRHGGQLWVTDGSEEGTKMVKEINPEPQGRHISLGGVNEPSLARAYKGGLVFVADDGVHGEELWRSDGTEMGTTMLGDFNPGSGGSKIQINGEYNGILYFLAESGSYPTALWATDGTNTGTFFFHDLPAGREKPRASELLCGTQGDPYFFSGDSLWVTDGTRPGTRILKAAFEDFDLSQTACLPSPEGRAHLVFVADDGTHGKELWRSDGTEMGTVMIKDIHPGAGSWLTQLFMLDGRVHFVADDGIHGKELWVSDGTPQGTKLVKDMEPGPGGDLRVIRHTAELAFLRQGQELWASDGTFEGSRQLVSLPQALNPFFHRPLISEDGELYFTADDGTHGKELWVSDGTPQGTRPVRGAQPGSAYKNPEIVGYVLGQVMMSACDAFLGCEFWASDGTGKGTRKLKDINPATLGSTQPLIETAGTLYFSSASTATPHGLWTTGGAPQTTQLVADGVVPKTPSAMVYFRGKHYFSGYNQAHGEELWVTDGTSDGTMMVKDLWPKEQSGLVGFEGAIEHGGKLYFAGDDGVHGRELWATDGTSEGTTMVKDLCPGNRESRPSLLGIFNGELLLWAEDSSQALRLWRSNGTPEGTMAITPRSVEFMGPVTLYKEKLYFPGRDGNGDYGLLRSDGTRDGIQLVKGISGDRPTSVNRVHLFEDTLYFVASDSTHGREWWRSDGTTAGTRLIKDVMPGRGDGAGRPDKAWFFGGHLYFHGDDGIHGQEVWKSDGTEQGTTLLLDIYPGKEDSDPWIYLDHEGTLYFSADDGTHGYELWTTDGTSQGTRMLADIFPGPSGSVRGYPVSPHRDFGLQPYGGSLYFVARDGVHGAELWVTNGTSEGTRLIEDIWVGQGTGVDASSSPLQGGRLYFGADDGLSGQELWVLD